MANRYWNPAGAANWGDANVWATTDGGDPTGVATPTSSDNVFFTSSNSYTCTIAATASCLDLDCSGFVGTLTGSSGITVYGNFLLSSGMTYTHTGITTLRGANKNITSNGKTIEYLSVENGGRTLQDDLIFNTLLSVYGSSVTFNFNNKNATGKAVQFSSSASITLGNGTITLTGNYANDAWYAESTNTITANSSTIKNTGTGAFNGGGKTYNNYWITNNSNVKGSNTFNNLKIDAGKTVKFYNTTNTTVTTFTALGTSGSHIIIQPLTGAATLTKAGGGVISGCDYVDATNLTGSPATTWYIGPNSTVTTCTEIYASDAPSAATGNFFMVL